MMFDYYISGKMTGMKDFNRPKFNAVAKRLRSKGHTVFNPAEITGGDEWGWEEYMRESLKGLAESKELILLNGYESSKGARIELRLARELGMKIKYEGEGLI